MQIGIFADTHDHLDHIRRAVEVFNAAGCELVVFAGDFVSSFALPPLRKLNCPLVACWGDNEGNRRGVAAGMTILGEIGEPPFCHTARDGTRLLIAHMERQFGSDRGEFDVAVFAHSHRASLSLDERGRLYINPGEASGWSFGNPTVVLLETATRDAKIVSLKLADAPAPS